MTEEDIYRQKLIDVIYSFTLKNLNIRIGQKFLKIKNQNVIVFLTSIENNLRPFVKLEFYPKKEEGYYRSFQTERHSYYHWLFHFSTENLENIVFKIL